MKSIPSALRDVAKAFEALAQAYETQSHAQAVVARQKPASGSAKAPPVIPLPERDEEEDDDLMPASLRILSALTAAGAPLERSPICIRAGLAYKSSTTDRALAELRAAGLIVTNGRLNAITDDGAAVQGPELPTGYGLFDYWVGELGGANSPPGRVLLALRGAFRDGQLTLTREEICERSGLEYKSSTTDRALADCRRLELVQTIGRQNELHADLRAALAPTISVFDRQTGKSVKVGREGTVRS